MTEEIGQTVKLTLTTKYKLQEQDKHFFKGWKDNLANDRCFKKRVYFALSFTPQTLAKIARTVNSNKARTKEALQDYIKAGVCKFEKSKKGSKKGNVKGFYILNIHSEK